MMKTFVFDLDGTIVLNGKPIEEGIAQSIKVLAENNEIIFSSARPVRDMIPLIPKGLNECMMVGCNGGMAWKNGICLFKNIFEKKSSDKIIGFLEKEYIPYVIDGDWDYALSSVSHSFHDYIRSLSEFEVDRDRIINDGVTKILILDGGFKERLNSFLEQNRFCFNINYHKSDDCFDITPQKEDKWLSLRRMKVNFSKTISFGNDANDFTLLNNSKISVFIGHETDYPNATYYCKTKDIPMLLPTIIDSFNDEANII